MFDFELSQITCWIIKMLMYSDRGHLVQYWAVFSFKVWNSKEKGKNTLIYSVVQNFIFFIL